MRPFKRLTARLRLGVSRRARTSHADEETRQNIDANAGGGGGGDGGGAIEEGANENDEGNDGGGENDAIRARSDHFDDTSTLSSGDGESDSDEDGGSDLDLPSGYLAFLASQQDDVDDEISDIANKLRGSKRRASPLVQIRLVREVVDDGGVIQIASAMEEGCSSCPAHYPESLERNVCSIGAVYNSDDLATLPRCPPCRCPSRNLTEIILSKCHVRDEGACALAHAISNSWTPSLKTLDLSSNHITGIAVASLANNCVVNRHASSRDGQGCNLETLVLSSNPILSAGACALANALRGKLSECQRHSECLSNNASALGKAGFCSLKKLHVSGCQLNDEDAIALGEALLPGDSHSDSPVCNGGVPDSPNFPTLPLTNHLRLLNLHGNRITMRGMEFLYSVIHNGIPHSSTSMTAEDIDIHCLQNLYCTSNHLVEIGVIVDYGTRDYNYGNFFDQAQDENLLLNMRNYEMTGTEPDGDLEQMKVLVAQKWLLKEKMLRALNINRRSTLELERASFSAASPEEWSPVPKEERQRILSAGARDKIVEMLVEKLRPPPIVLPRRQDEYGRFLEADDFLGISDMKDVGITSLAVGKCFANLDLKVFPRVISWLIGRFDHSTAMSIVFDILLENPDVCGFRTACEWKRQTDGKCLSP